MTSRTAFSNAFMVMMSLGLMSLLMHTSSAAVALATSATFSACSPPLPPLSFGSHAGIEDEYGTDMPRASMAEAMVFAVYMPPHAPGPGQEERTMSCRVLSSIFLPTYSP